MKLFVYGTLLSGLERHELMASACCLGPAIVSGRLIDLGSHPGLLEGTACVVGELYEVDDVLVGRLDTVEGFHPADLNRSLYVRRDFQARLFANPSSVAAQAYFYNQSRGDEPPIDCGDYRRLRAWGSSPLGLIWVVAYGSNLETARLDGRLLSIGPERAKDRNASMRVGYLDGFELIFNKKSNDGTRANAKYAGDKSACPGVAWALNDEELKILDLYEAAPTAKGFFHYRRIGLPFRSSHGVIMAHAYLADPDHLCDPTLPPEDYLRHIRLGYCEHGLPRNHLEEAIREVGVNARD